MINKLKQLYRDWVLVHYNPEEYTHPDRIRKLKAKNKKQGNLASHEIIGTGIWAPDEAFMDDSSQFALSKATEIRLHTGRTKELSDKDIEILSERNLNIQKAVLIKPYWALGYSREEISGALSYQEGKKVSGYSVSTVGAICAAFSSVLSESTYQTLSESA